MSSSFEPGRTYWDGRLRIVSRSFNRIDGEVDGRHFRDRPVSRGQQWDPVGRRFASEGPEFVRVRTADGTFRISAMDVDVVEA